MCVMTEVPCGEQQKASVSFPVKTQFFVVTLRYWSLEVLEPFSWVTIGMKNKLYNCLGSGKVILILMITIYYHTT